MAKRVIEKVKSYIEKAREFAPNVTNDMLDADGAIYYANGNDGTDFDWDMNGRLCEFMVYAKNGMGFIKVFVTNQDIMEGYVYEDFGMRPTRTLEPEKLEEGDAGVLANFFYQEADCQQIWDATLDVFDFDAEVTDWIY
jgi:hypothetical protein